MRLKGFFEPRITRIITDKTAGGCGGKASVLPVESVVEKSGWKGFRNHGCHGWPRIRRLVGAVEKYPCCSCNRWLKAAVDNRPDSTS